MANLKTLDNTLKVLSHFTYRNKSWGVREMGRKVGLNHTVVFRIMSTLEDHGFLRKNKTTKKYEIGFKFLEFRGLLQDTLNIPETMNPIMEVLTNSTGESSVLTWLEGEEGVYINIVESLLKIKFHDSLGISSSLCYGASHRIIMAFLSSEKQKEIFRSEFTQKGRDIPEQLIEDLETFKKQGWGYSQGEYLEGVAALAVPLFNRNQEIIGSLTIAGPSYRMSYQKSMKLLESLKEAQVKMQSSLSKLLF